MTCQFSDQNEEQEAEEKDTKYQISQVNQHQTATTNEHSSSSKQQQQ